MRAIFFIFSMVLSPLALAAGPNSVQRFAAVVDGLPLFRSSDDYYSVVVKRQAHRFCELKGFDKAVNLYSDTDQGVAAGAVVKFNVRTQFARLNRHLEVEPLTLAPSEIDVSVDSEQDFRLSYPTAFAVIDCI